MFMILGVVSIRLYYLQVLHHQENVELADRNRIRLQRVPAPRGLVFDRNHRPLVDTRPSFDAQIVPEDSDNLSLTIERLERYTGGDHIADKISDADEEGRPPYEPVTVAERLGWQQVVALEAHQLDLPGVSLQITPARHYLYGELAAHLLGYVGEVTRNDLQQRADYHMGDEIGKFGLERVWESFLRGDAGGQEIEVDAVGRRLRRARSEKRRRARDGFASGFRPRPLWRRCEGVGVARTDDRPEPSTAKSRHPGNLPTRLDLQNR